MNLTIQMKQLRKKKIFGNEANSLGLNFNKEQNYWEKSLFNRYVYAPIC